VESKVRENEGLVTSLVARTMRLFPKLPSGYDREDLESIGYMGLVRAAQGYDPGRGVAFSTYAYHCIDNAIRGQLQRANHRDIECISLDVLIGTDESSPLADMIPDEGPDAEAQAVDSAGKEALLRIVFTLPPDQAGIIYDIYFREERPAEVARSRGLSPQRVHQLHRRALSALRRRLREQGDWH
jgi:RNA polymerase sigma factor (sigma-70 family)